MNVNIRSRLGKQAGRSPVFVFRFLLHSRVKDGGLTNQVIEFTHRHRKLHLSWCLLRRLHCDIGTCSFKHRFDTKFMTSGSIRTSTCDISVLFAVNSTVECS